MTGDLNPSSLVPKRIPFLDPPIKGNSLLPHLRYMPLAPTALPVAVGYSNLPYRGPPL